jgi:fatty acid desaturase
MKAPDHLYGELLERADLRELARVSPYYGFLSVLAIWVLIGGLFGLLLAFPPAAPWQGLLVFCVALLPVAALQNALIQLAHEGIHGLLHPNRRWNDWFSALVVALPLGIPFGRMRAHHLAHHRHLGEPETDPDRFYYKDFSPRARELVLELFKSLSGFYVLRRSFEFLRGARVASAAKSGDSGLSGESLLVYGLHLALAGSLLLTGSYWALAVYALLWVLPILTCCRVLQQWCLMIEHGTMLHAERTRDATASPEQIGDPVERVLRLTRSTVGRDLSRFVVGSFGLNYHVEHHLYPVVPYYHLAELRARLLERPVFQRTYHQGASYFQLSSR